MIEKLIFAEEISGFPEYLIFSDGRIYSKKRNKYLKLNPVKGGYLQVKLYKFNNNIKKNIYVSRLVAEHFIHNKENKKEVNHLDGDKNNNDINNLEWATPKENMQHAYDNGFQIAIKGKDHYCAKLTENDVIEIRKIFPKIPSKDLAEKYNVTPQAIDCVIKRKSWRHI